jgi:Tfp pilus assembly protein PilE
VVVVTVNQDQRAVAVAVALARPSWARYISQPTQRSRSALAELATVRAEQAFKEPTQASDQTSQSLPAVAENLTRLQARSPQPTHRSSTLVQVAVDAVKQARLQAERQCYQARMVSVVVSLSRQTVAAAVVELHRSDKTLSQAQAELAVQAHK